MGIPANYVERVYAGWYGKLIGIRHGSNIEGWSYDQIAAKYGEIKGYLFDFKNFAADDDSNGPIFFIRALEDYTCTESITPAQMGRTVLNYVPCEHGFFWWGGYGRSTEHTAYLNLMHGVEAPLSGSMALNGAAVAEQIGGQIFIDTWGLVNPCDYRRAARYAEKMASVTHGGNGVYGGMFVAACVSAAFEEREIMAVINKGLSVIPEDCEYRRMANDVIAFHAAHPGDWRACFAFVRAHYGYDRYPGCCHIIPNAAVVILSLLYGGGRFSDAINICNMCGWDTDCNVANVGAIMGVLVGLEGIDRSWIDPIGDFLACSSVMACMNLRDVANDALFLASLGYRIAGEAYPSEWAAHLDGSAPGFAFPLPGSTHTFRSEGASVAYANIPFAAPSAPRCLEAAIPATDGPVRLYRQTYYRPGDFSDDRYSPSFTPEVFPGQTVHVTLRLRDASAGPVQARAYVYDLYNKRYIYGEPAQVSGWTGLQVRIPAGDGCIGQAGVEIAGQAQKTVVLIDSMTYTGLADYTLDFAKAGVERWNLFHAELSQTSNTKGIWEADDQGACGSCADHAELITGGRNFAGCEILADITPQVGRRHLVCVRVQGAMRGYMAGFWDDELVIIKNDEGVLRRLAARRFSWQRGRAYTLAVEARGAALTLKVDGETCLQALDEENPWLDGCVGLSLREGSRCRIRSLRTRCFEG